MSKINDKERLRAIARLGLTDDRHRDMLQKAVDEACAQLDLRTAAVSIIFEGAQYWVAHQGVEGWMAAADGTPVEWSFCQNVVRDDAEFEVEDATTHDKVKDSPLVAIDGVRCYLGIPLVTSDGHNIGSFCVVGSSSRSFSEGDREFMRAKAAEVMRLIEEAAD